MSKEEKIKEAWGDKSEEYKPTENGWSFKIIYEWDNFEFKKFETKLVGHGMYRIRPKSLQGIENNNGWIKIESEADLPKEDGLFWIVEDGVVINQPCNYSANLKKWYLYAQQYPTHYQPIEKPQPPIY